MAGKRIGQLGAESCIHALLLLGSRLLPCLPNRVQHICRVQMPCTQSGNVSYQRRGQPPRLLGCCRRKLLY
jgi:hypothetical protein